MRAPFSFGLLLVAAIVAVSCTLPCCRAFVLPSPGIVGSSSSCSSRPSRLMMASDEEILAAYRKNINAISNKDAPVVLSLPETPPVTVDDTTTPPPPVVSSITTTDGPPPNVFVDTTPPVTALPDNAPPAVVGTDPISTFWRQITEPFKSMPDVLEPLKIPKEPFKDAKPMAMPDLKGVDLRASLKSVTVPDVGKSLKSVSLPDLKESLKSVPDDFKESLKSVPDDFKQSLKSVPDDFKQSLKSVPDLKQSLPDLKSVTERVKSLQLPTPPERPDGTGMILPDGSRMPTLLDLWSQSHPDWASKYSGGGSKFTASWLPGLLESLRVAEFGAWYVAAVCLVAWQVQVGNKEKQFARELKEAEKKANLAAEAAAVAAQGATVAKDLAATATKKRKSKKSTEAVLTDSKMHAMELEKQALKKELESLQLHTEELKKQLQMATATADVNGAVEAPVAAPIKVEPRDPKEDERVLEVIKEQDIANASAATATKTKPKAAKKSATKKKAATKTQKVTAKKKTSPRKEKAVAKELDDVVSASPKKKAAAKKTSAKKGKVVAKEATKVVVVEMEEKDLVPVEGAKDVFFANATAPATAKQVPQKTAAASSKSHSDNPWSSLSLSTLKRKTVKELSAYLSERDVQVTNNEGKPLKKAELVESVLSL